ncbi:MAG TPA: prolipoprotein diacylglyceryl transferase family protein [Chitinophagaceae bacterium]|nr:prolipoprotein diacylglyceryl transferase family protein [Chitinophagaceae bacterium]
MYPNLYYAFKDIFGVEWNFLRFVNSFGFFVAIAFIISAIVLSRELRRKSRQGLFQPTEMQVMVGQPATYLDLGLNFLLGFLLGYKILALFIMQSSATDDPQAFIFSTLGSWPAGIGLGILFAGLKWWDKNKQKLDKPEKRTVRIWPQDRVGEITILALIFGLLGAKLFDIFENWGGFLKNPSAYIFSASGLTMYGGLICASIAIWIYARKHKISFWHLNDSAAPTLMLAYAIGRIGCQVAGDGDWGVYNSAYIYNNENKLVLAAPGDFEKALDSSKTYFLKEYSTLQEVPHAYFKKPDALGFLPNWFFAYNFPHNVNETGVPITNCRDAKYCSQLPLPVYPTPLYEVLACSVLFLILWYSRKKFKIPGTLFAFYLVLNGFERFFIEKIRVNTRLDIFGFHPTQAEVISTLLFLTGLTIWVILKRKAGAVKSGS